MNSNTNGAVLMEDAIPEETGDRVDEIVDDYYSWYNGIPPAKQEIVNKTAFPVFIESHDARDGSTAISYPLDKSHEQECNMVFRGKFLFKQTLDI